MNDSFMKEKPVLPLILSMALPMVVSMLVNSLYNIVDSFFVAQISEQAMTALSLVYPVQNLINAVAIGFGVGINAVIAYHLGARQPESASMAATHGTALSALHGLVLTAVCIPLMPWFLGMFTDDRTVIEQGSQYAGIAFSFSVVIMVIVLFYRQGLMGTKEFSWDAIFAFFGKIGRFFKNLFAGQKSSERRCGK